MRMRMRMRVSSVTGACYTPGYADPIIINGGEYSTVTDGYAVGVTLLVCLTNRSPVGLADKFEAEMSRDWDDIPGAELAFPAAAWPAAEADAVKELALAARGGACLCAMRKRRRTSIEHMLRTLRELVQCGSPERQQ